LSSLIPAGHAEGRHKPTLRVNQSSIYTGDTVTLRCELHQSTGWEFLWHRYNQQSKPLN
ncbi:Fc receptor-like protein 5 isoform X1, partial [Clarias magur]